MFVETYKSSILPPTLNQAWIPLLWRKTHYSAAHVAISYVDFKILSIFLDRRLETCIQSHMKYRDYFFLSSQGPTAPLEALPANDADDVCDRVNWHD